MVVCSISCLLDTLVECTVTYYTYRCRGTCTPEQTSTKINKNIFYGAIIIFTFLPTCTCTWHCTIAHDMHNKTKSILCTYTFRYTYTAIILRLRILNCNLTLRSWSYHCGESSDCCCWRHCGASSDCCWRRCCCSCSFRSHSCCRKPSLGQTSRLSRTNRSASCTVMWQFIIR